MFPLLTLSGCGFGPLCDLDRVHVLAIRFTHPLEMPYEVEGRMTVGQLEHVTDESGLRIQDVVLHTDDVEEWLVSFRCDDGRKLDPEGNDIGACVPDEIGIPMGAHEVDLKLRSGDAEMTVQDTIEYEPHFENGPDCPPNGIVGLLVVDTEALAGRRTSSGPDAD